MLIAFDTKEFRSFSQHTQDEILDRLLDRRARVIDDADIVIDPDIDMDEVVGLSFREVQNWMERASEKTKAGLRVFAEKGPVVRARELVAAGVENLSHFQSRVTIRTRTITGDADAFLLGWDDWAAVDEGEGRYAVSPETYHSLRRFFKIA